MLGWKFTNIFPIHCNWLPIMSIKWNMLIHLQDLFLKTLQCEFCHPISPWWWVTDENGAVKITYNRGGIYTAHAASISFMPYKHFSNEMLHGIWMQWKYLLGHFKDRWILGRNIRSRVVTVDKRRCYLKAEWEQIIVHLPESVSCPSLWPRD